MERSKIVYNIWKILYISLKNLMFAQFLYLFLSQNWRTFYHLLDMKCCQMFCQNWRTHFGAILEGLSISCYKLFFAFFGAKTGVLSIPYGLHIQSCPIFLPFFEPKLEDLKLFEVGCPDLSWVSVLHTSWVKRWSEAKDFL